MEAGVPTCAVCKHLGKQCDETCILRPYFPIERNEEFHFVHNFYGIPNLKKIVLSVDEEDRARAVETITIESKMRLQDRVHGSLRVKKLLEAELSKAEKELNIVNQRLRYLRGAGGANYQSLHHSRASNNSDLKGKRKI